MAGANLMDSFNSPTKPAGDVTGMIGSETMFSDGSQIEGNDTTSPPNMSLLEEESTKFDDLNADEHHR